MEYVAQLFLDAVPDLNSKLLPQESKVFLLRLEELDPTQDAEKFGFCIRTSLQRKFMTRSLGSVIS
jgi:hypothetical protein